MIHEVANDIINIGMMVKNNYPEAEIYISSIPPRKDYLNEHAKETNEIMKNSIVESLNFIANRNLKI